MKWKIQKGMNRKTIHTYTSEERSDYFIARFNRCGIFVVLCAIGMGIQYFFGYKSWHVGVMISFGILMVVRIVICVTDALLEGKIDNEKHKNN